jgi:predicted transcriptional regulator
MATRKIKKDDQAFLKKLGKKIEKIILEDMNYSSLDAFSIEHHDLIAKPTLYQICQGKRDMKISTLRGLAAALGISLKNLVE